MKLMMYCILVIFCCGSILECQEAKLTSIAKKQLTLDDVIYLKTFTYSPVLHGCSIQLEEKCM